MRTRCLSYRGGFSFGDDVASGKILANRLRYRLGGQLQQFVRDGKLILGICNGFQVLAKMGMLPMLSGDFVQEVTLTFNDSGRFEDRWVCLRTEPGTRCIWLNGITDMELPVRHGEGKFVPRDSDVLNRMKAEGLVALRYVRPDGAPARGEFPANPNGSIEDIAGICDVTGRVFGLMPHPEGHICRMQHPRWTRERDAAPDSPAIGLRVFENAVNYVRRYLAA